MAAVSNGSSCPASNGLASGTREIAEREGVRVNYVQKIIKLVDLALDISTAILNGRQPHTLTSATFAGSRKTDSLETARQSYSPAQFIERRTVMMQDSDDLDTVAVGGKVI